ncbi:MAG: DUF2080 family transposase-associated protein [Thermoplasmata archaeon]|nr:DUF2080 family transposase-associated protein [Thermoplasmata archaeon]
MARKRKVEKDVFQVWGYELIIKRVTDAKTTGKVYLPKDWIGKRVKVIRMDE